MRELFILLPRLLQTASSQRNISSLCIFILTLLVSTPDSHTFKANVLLLSHDPQHFFLNNKKPNIV